MSANELIINIAKDFSLYPGGREIKCGPHSGEEFRNRFLCPAMDKNDDQKIVIDFDGARGYGSSFLEEAFGGLVRLGYQSMDILRKFEFKSRDKTLIYEVEGYINSAQPD